ncbi:MAG: uroporphyrinogen decarboxylase family protein [Clostridia bacterium]|nr:uroporphyrinogen decarboxylase family protein [Clostridia bacterium]
MKNKVKKLLENKKHTVPILSFPSTQILGISVNELISSSDMQLKGMQAIADRFSIGVSLNMMDLSVEAEAFGAKVRFYDDDVPTVEKGIIDDISDVESILVPEVGAGRTSICIDGVKKAKKVITDIPVFCGVIGPYSLAGRLFDMTELMIECFDSPDEVKILLSKATEFIIKYIKAFKEVGADGVIMAEPAAGLLSPSLAEEFSMPFVRQIFDEINSDDFIICYHNCGKTAENMLDMIGDLSADIIHLGNAINIKKALEVLPRDKIIMGNVDPVSFKTGTPDSVAADVQRVFDECSGYGNFMISTGCDVPAAAKTENIEAYFKKVNELYS